MSIIFASILGIFLPTVDTRGVVIERFAKAVRGEGSVPVSGQEARQALEVVRAAYLSQERGQPVAAPVRE